ncbi:unnamed protein product [Mytilus coruscus]|uniref:4Fe-4S ferredoxin-type domain-containing protein n=1 Tax=Mytilus coruscus TaxID=42192 RepID=A0A6J8DB24_MYTCO|nr:unnamed protein product [Mytilus coruscus]
MENRKKPGAWERSEAFTRITCSSSKCSAQLSTKRTSFKHKYVVCGSGSIISYHSANSIDIAATAASSNAAHQKAAVIVSRMIAHMPSTYCHTLASRAQVGVFTKAESMAVYPDYAYMADRPECRGICSGSCSSTCTFDGRKWSTTAGSGGRLASILDDNLLCDSQDPYRHGFNVLIHEFAHTIHGYALDGSMKSRGTRKGTSNLVQRYSKGIETVKHGKCKIYQSKVINSSKFDLETPCNNHQCSNEMAERRHIYDKDRELYNILAWVYDSNQVSQPGNLATCI